MKQLLSLLLLLPGLAWAQSGFVVNGKLTGLLDGTEIKISSSQDNNMVVARGTAKGGAFSIQGSVPEPGLYFIAVGAEQPQHIFLENDTITISGVKKDLKNMRVEGSRSHQDFEEFRRIFNPMIAELSGKAAQINKSADEKKTAVLMAQYDSIGKVIKGEVGKFVAGKPASYVSPFLLFITAQIDDDPITLEQRFGLLDESIRKSGIGKSLAEYIAYNKVGAIGTEAMDFTQTDLNGKPVSLSSLRGKYVLIDFWASWCKPCREENPNVVKAYQQFNAKNFTVLGVSLDREKEAWANAVKRDNLTWTQVSDLQFWNNEAAVLYRVQGIPQNFLVDPSGKIVAKNLRGPALIQKLGELLEPAPAKTF